MASSQEAPAPPIPGVDAKPCPEDWAKSRRGNCLTKTHAFGGGPAWAYVHKGGWIVDPRCFADSRFSGKDFMTALDTVVRKLDPRVPAHAGGCLGTFNPAFGREVTDHLRQQPTHIMCGEFDTKERTCADHHSWQSGPQTQSLIRLRNIRGCTGPLSTGLAGVLFHETLHAAGADSFPIEKHNQAWNMEQWQFINDRVYGTEAVCFWGTDPKLRGQVNILQCKGTVSYLNYNAPWPHPLCEGFNYAFTDLPAGFIKH